MQTTQLLTGSLGRQGTVLGNLGGCAQALEIAALKDLCTHPLIVICSDTLDASRLEQELRYLCASDEISVFRDYETLPYDVMSPHQDIISSRIEFLSRAPGLSKGIVITSLHAVMQRLAPLEFMMQNSFNLKVGDDKDLSVMRDMLVERGYLHVQQVLSPGEIATRGGILDLFPMGLEQPLRIDFLGDEVESISYFDVQTQRSSQSLDHVKILPANEFPVTEESISVFRTNYRKAFDTNNITHHTVYQMVSKGSIPPGIEYYLPLFFDKTATFFDYVHPQSSIVLTGDFEKALKDYDQTLHQRAYQICHDVDHPSLPVYDVFVTPHEFISALNERDHITLRTDPALAPTKELYADAEGTSDAATGASRSAAVASSGEDLNDEVLTGAKSYNTEFINAPCLSVPEVAFDRYDHNSKAKLMAFVDDFCIRRGGRILISAISEGRRQNLHELLPGSLIKTYGLKAASSISDFLASDAPLMMTIAPFDQGVIIDPSDNGAASVRQIKEYATSLVGATAAYKKAMSYNQETANTDAPVAAATNVVSAVADAKDSAASSAGTIGIDGSVGAKGSVGAEGSVGAKGSVGTEGTVGAEGAIGTEGTVGANDDAAVSESATEAKPKRKPRGKAKAKLEAEQSEAAFASAAAIAGFDCNVVISDMPGLTYPIAFLTETELLGFKVVRQRKRSRRAQQIDQDTIIKNLAQLTEGEMVVHIDHGIGKYMGLKTEVINGVKGEFIGIEYQGGDKLFLPITALNKIARYSGEENPALSKLGNDTWSKKKDKAAQKVRDVAAELLDLYAQRELRQGFSFSIDRHAYDEFVSNFPYEETEDQQKAIEQTLNDMRKPVAMDRLICGDVGFGKTEVALRAAFVAAMNGKQVAVLAPTTILAEQHYQNFKERFGTTAINVDIISRFKTAKQQTETIKKVREGEIDIVIGTHSLLSNRVAFKDLGLLIIDEEHRFGVRQKEKLKALRAEVDLLTLTATPIPRTLNMALEGMRELSIIATAPEHRLAVKTFVHEDSDQLCREAIMRELRRGGQVYYLHNEVSTMESKFEELQKLVPEAKIEIAHGQMDERRLQKVMQDFCHQRFNVLLCSTIVENGLDIPTANTIIIDRADLLGLAQLHQIRGRVGRSHHQAYAYMFTPHEKAISADAKRRLDAISGIDDLGAGFILASHDLEIRGAGELLGEEQSGQITAIGFSLYMDMLNAAVKALKEGREPTLSELTLNECDIDMHLPAFLPDNYINDVNTRLSMYKRVASCKSVEDFDNLKIELVDRFGSLPQEAENLFTISRLKQTATKLGIAAIRGDQSGALIKFDKSFKVDPQYIVSLVQKSKHGEYRITQADAVRYTLPESDKHSRLKLLEMVLRAFYAHSSLNTSAA